MKITGIHLIETGVVNRNDGTGTMLELKTVPTHTGVKVFFSPASYKSSLWTLLQRNYGWSKPEIYGGKTNKDVVQRTGTIVESEELDFGGTMIANEGYKRLSVLSVDYGVSINNFKGTLEFNTNSRLASFANSNNNIIHRQQFIGLYLLPFGIETERIGCQYIKDIKSENIKEIEKEKDTKNILGAIYKYIFEKDYPEEVLEKLSERVESIQIEKNGIKIALKREERRRRLWQLLTAMGELYRKIEGGEKPLFPTISVLAVNTNPLKYLPTIKEMIETEYIQNEYINLTELYPHLKQKIENLHKTEEERLKNALNELNIPYQQSEKWLFLPKIEDYTETVLQIVKIVDENIFSKGICDDYG